MWGSAAVIGLQMLPILGRADETCALGRTRGTRDRPRHRIPAHQLHPRRRRGPSTAAASTCRRSRWRCSASTATGCARTVVDEPIRNLLAWEIERARALYRSAERGVRSRASDLARLPADRARPSTQRSSTRSSGGTMTSSRDGSASAFGAGREVGLSGLRSARRARRDACDPATPTSPASPAPSRSRTADPRPARRRSASR